MSEFIFPLRKRPKLSYKTGHRFFGANRKWNSATRQYERLHAGCDLIVPKGTEVLAMADGKVIRGPYHFYSGTYALEIQHDNGKVVRYGEISPNLPKNIKKGERVSQGQVIARVGRLRSGSSMLHLEMYQGTKRGSLKGSGVYKRRSDLIDPTPYLDKAPLKNDITLPVAPWERLPQSILPRKRTTLSTKPHLKDYLPSATSPWEKLPQSVFKPSGQNISRKGIGLRSPLRERLSDFKMISQKNRFVNPLNKQARNCIIKPSKPDFARSLVSRNYMVRKNDTLGKLSSQFGYRNPRQFVKDFQKLNPEVKNPNLIYAESTYKMPYRTSVGILGLTKTSRRPFLSDYTGAPTSTSYRPNRGDTLYKLAPKFGYQDDPKRFVKDFQKLNPEVKNPNLIYADKNYTMPNRGLNKY